MSTETKPQAVVPTREAVAAEVVKPISAPSMRLGTRRRLRPHLRSIEQTEQVTTSALQAGSRIMANATMGMGRALHVSAIAANAASLQGEEELIRVMHLRERYLDDMNHIVAIASHKLKTIVADVPDSGSYFNLKDELGL